MSNPTFVADELVTASKMNELPKGWLGYAQVTANQNTISTVADLTGLSVTVTVAANRRIRIVGHCQVLQNTSASFPLLHAKEAAVMIGRLDGINIAAAARTVLDGSVIVSPTAGSHTYKLTLESGTGTVNMEAAVSGTAPGPAFILVEDLGSV